MKIGKTTTIREPELGKMPKRVEEVQVRSGVGARAATALRHVHLSAPLPRPIPGDRPGLLRAH